MLPSPLLVILSEAQDLRPQGAPVRGNGRPTITAGLQTVASAGKWQVGSSRTWAKAR